LRSLRWPVGAPNAGRQAVIKSSSRRSVPHIAVPFTTRRAVAQAVYLCVITFESEDVVGIGWSELPRSPVGMSRQELAKVLQATYPNASPNTIANNAGQIWNFVNTIALVAATPRATPHSCAERRLGFGQSHGIRDGGLRRVRLAGRQSQQRSAATAPTGTDLSRPS